jgi:hypothetical protein
MSFHVYNTKNQALKANKLSEILSYISEDFAGVITDDWSVGAFDNPTQIEYSEVGSPTGNPKTSNYYEFTDGIGYFPSQDMSVVEGKTYYTYNNYWIWHPDLRDKEITFIGAGINIGYDVPTPDFEESSGYWPYESGDKEYLYGIDVIVPGDNSSIASDAGRVWLCTVSCDSISQADIYIIVDNPAGNPVENGYYEYTGSEFQLTEDEQVVSGKIYYYVIKDEAIKVTNASFPNRADSTAGNILVSSFEYYGNTVWVQRSLVYNGMQARRFFIPICYRSVNSLGGYYSNNIIFRRDKQSYNSFLSARTYYNLLNELSGKFVHRSGGPKVGDIGNLNITNSTISSNQGDSIENMVSINRPHVTGLSVIDNKYPEVSNIIMLGGTGEANDDTDPDRIGCKKGRLYRTPDNWYIPVTHGGTSATEQYQARRNLGFYFGKSIPTADPKLNGTPGYLYSTPVKVDNQPDYGRVWFRIL